MSDHIIQHVRQPDQLVLTATHRCLTHTRDQHLAMRFTDDTATSFLAKHPQYQRAMATINYTKRNGERCYQVAEQ